MPRRLRRGFLYYLTDGREKYIWWCDGREQLFDLQNDPRELCDLVESEPQKLENWRQKLIEKLRERPEGWSDGATLTANQPYFHSMPHAVLG